MYKNPDNSSQLTRTSSLLFLIRILLQFALPPLPLNPPPPPFFVINCLLCGSFAASFADDRTPKLVYPLVHPMVPLAVYIPNPKLKTLPVFSEVVLVLNIIISLFDNFEILDES